MTGSSPDFDPRFPRAFPPGYAGSDSTALEALDAQAQSGEPEQPAVNPPPTVPVPEIPLPGAGHPPKGGSSLPVDGSHDTGSPSIKDEEAGTPTRRRSQLRNPFLIGLILLAVAFAAGGLWFANLAASAYAGEVFMGTQEMVLIQLMSIIAPVLLSGSILTTVAILFFFALRWSR